MRQNLVRNLSTAAAALWLAACATTGSDAEAQLSGTSWQLVKFQGGDGAVLTPDDPAKYTFTFNPDGSVQARFDCNQGRGVWRVNPPSGLEFGTVVMTRASCPPPSLYDEVARRWSYIRSYQVRDGHLFLSMLTDGGVFEFEPKR